MLLVRNTLFENPWHVSQLKRRFYPEATAIILGLSPGLLAGDGPVQREAGLFAPLHSFSQFLEWILVFLPKRLTLSMHKGPMSRSSSLAAEGLGRLTAVVLVGREELAGGAKFWAEGAGELRREAAELPTGCSAGARCPLPRAAFSHA